MTYMQFVLYLMNVAILSSDSLPDSVKSAMSFVAFVVKRYLTKCYFIVFHFSQVL